MIDVIIPAYNANEFIHNLLFSLVTQTVKDLLKVYIINDCSDKDYSAIVKKFKGLLNIKEVKAKKNGGPGAARQLGIDSSSSPYIVFADADDIFYDCYSIEKLYNKIDSEGHNVVSGLFVEETPDSVVYDRGANVIWMHGKIFRRSFIEDFDIRFNNTRANEDTGFNKLAYICSDYCFIDDYVYVWKCINTSITRSGDYSFYGLEGFTYNICWAVKEAEERNCDYGRTAYIIYESIFDLYYRYVYYSDREDKDLILKWAKDLKECYLRYKDSLDYNSKEEVIFRVVDFLYHSYLGPDKFINNELSFNQFLDLIG